MKQAISCPIIGQGTEADPRRPKCADYDVNWSADMTSDPDTCIAIAAGDLSKLLADPDIELIATTPDRSAPDGSTANTLAGLYVIDPNP